MGSYVEENLEYYLKVPIEEISTITSIRPWLNLKLGYDENSIWIKGFNYVQINSVEVKSIPYKTIYACRHSKLYHQFSELPERAIPSILWTPIDRALPLEISNFNHNYFGLNQQISCAIIPSNNELPATFLLVSTKDLYSYLISSSQIRIQPIQWVLLNNDLALLKGVPFLPLLGDAYWAYNDFLFPAGFQLNVMTFYSELNDLLNPDRDYYILWSNQSTYSLIEKSSFTSLSKSSFLLTAEQFSMVF